MSNNLPAFNNLTDAELIQLVQNRNEEAFTELIFRYTPTNTSKIQLHSL